MVKLAVIMEIAGLVVMVVMVVKVEMVEMDKWVLV